MKKKFKLSPETTLDEIINRIEDLKSYDKLEMPVSEFENIFKHLGAKKEYATGSSIRFSHPELKANKDLNGFCSVHMIHGKKIELIEKVFYKRYVYRALYYLIQRQKDKQQ